MSGPYKKEHKYVYYVDVKCSCGTQRTITKSQLTSGQSKSCGCLQREVASIKKISVTVGETLGKLTIISDEGNTSGHRVVSLSCDCGSSVFQARYESFKSGHTKSCGCLQRQAATNLKLTHGMVRTPVYRSWQQMLERCRNPNSPGYENYGGRGISYPDDWNRFENFYEDLGDRPEKTTLDRIDVNGNYSKENCRWSDLTIQSHNRRKQEGCTSQYVGVYFDKRKSLWVSRLHYYKEVVFSETFTSEVEAAKAYDEACFEYYGVRKNFPETQTE